MKQTEIPEALAATLIHLLPKEKISISDIEDILKETLLIFKSIPLDIPKPKKQSISVESVNVKIRRYYERISGFSAQSKQNSVHVYL